MVDIPAQPTFKRYSLDGTNKRNRRQKMLGNTCGKTWGSSLTLDGFFFVDQIDPS